eukprot:GDKI01035130.1.p1 GENE.GDKI01035130.1~~GDKI01035130.1.p1  ORF type:complete len:424 (-),score=98.74 GDKI01035130.1:6-1214(-)
MIVFDTGALSLEVIVLVTAVACSTVIVGLTLWGGCIHALSWVNYRDFSDKCVLITGCDSGPGYELALSLEKRGFKRVFAGCLTQTGVDRLNQERESERIIPILLDVRERIAVSEAYYLIKKMCPNGLYALVNNAAVLRNGYFEVVPFDEWRLHFEVNVLGAVRTTKTFLPLIRRAQGRVINVSSICGAIGMPGLSAFSASKFALEGMSDCLRREAEPWGVNVVLVQPGLVKHALYGSINGERVVELWETSGKNKLEQALARAAAEEPQEGGETEEGTQTQTRHVSKTHRRVMNAVESALVSMFPRHRYTVGWDATLLRLVGYLPSTLQDAFFALSLPAPCPAALSPTWVAASPTPRRFLKLQTPRMKQVQQKLVETLRSSGKFSSGLLQTHTHTLPHARTHS